MYLRKNSRAGFTLTELLVVLAIISVLSGIVLVNVNAARNKGKNARAIADISQYMTGLALARERASDSRYPTTSGMVCLGSSTCSWGGSYLESGTVNSALEAVMSSLPGSIYEENGYRGYIYQSNGTEYTLQWFLYGEDRNCEFTETSSNSSGITLCTYNH